MGLVSCFLVASRFSRLDEEKTQIFQLYGPLLATTRVHLPLVTASIPMQSDKNDIQTGISHARAKWHFL